MPIKDDEIVNCVTMVLEYCQDIQYLKGLYVPSETETVSERARRGLLDISADIARSAARALHQAGTECFPELKSVDTSGLSTAIKANDLASLKRAASELDEEVTKAINQARRRVGLPA